MDKIWLQSYPPGVPAEISIDHCPSLVALFGTPAASMPTRSPTSAWTRP